MKLGWIGTVAFQVLDERRELVFDLADGQSLPADWREGDDVKIVNHPDHPANIAMDMNSGYYQVMHLPTGTKIDVKHDTSKWRFQKT